MVKKKQHKWNKWKVIIFTIATLAILSYIFSGILSLYLDEDFAGNANVALIKIDKVIITEDGIFGNSAVSSTDIIEFIKSADKNPAIKAIVFEINSPGGSAVASKEIADAVKKVNKTTISVIRELGTSGAYWIASSTDYIIANELSITGSIGVISSYLEFNELFEKYGINYRRLVSGKYKDIGSPFRNLTKEEEDILQKQLDKVHEFFIKEVSKNRNLKIEDVREMSNGLFYLGDEAFALGLVDELGDIETAKQRLKDVLLIDEVIFAEYKKPIGFIESFFQSINEQSYSVGRGIGEGLVSKGSTGSVVNA